MALRRVVKAAVGVVSLGGLAGLALYADFLRTYKRPHGWSAVPPGAPPPPLDEVGWGRRHAQLTPAELAAYERDGYLVVKGLLPPKYLARVREDALVGGHCCPPAHGAGS